MKIEWFEYWPTSGSADIQAIKARLPDHLKRGLMGGHSHSDYGIYVDAANSELITRLDDYFRVNTSSEFLKQRRVEIDRTEIKNFSHFFIGPQILDWQKDVFFSVSDSCCPTERCPWGSEINSPVTVRSRTLQKLAIGEIQRGLRMGVELIVSRQMKQLFDAAGISGLVYEPAESQAESHDIPSDPPAYVAKIASGATQTGREIILSVFCKAHHTVLSERVIDLQARNEWLHDVDFQLLNRLIVEGKEYISILPRWVVTRRILELLLQQKVPGLRRLTVFQNQRFLPLVL